MMTTNQQAEAFITWVAANFNPFYDDLIIEARGIRHTLIIFAVDSEDNTRMIENAHGPDHCLVSELLGLPEAVKESIGPAWRDNIKRIINKRENKQLIKRFL